MPASSSVEIIRDWISLSLVYGVGPTLFYQLVNRFGSPGAVLDNPGLAAKAFGVGSKPGWLAELTEAGRLRQRADRELLALDKIGARALIRSDPDYPELLRHIGQPPPVIYLHGDRRLLDMASVAIVESPGESRQHYIATLMSNVLKFNSAWDHSRVPGSRRACWGSTWASARVSPDRSTPCPP